jgi:hypothetical protein
MWSMQTNMHFLISTVTQIWTAWLHQAFTLIQTNAGKNKKLWSSSTNLIHFTITFTFTLLKLKASTYFGHHLPILRRHYINTVLVLVVVVCCYRCRQSILQQHTTTTKTVFILCLLRMSKWCPKHVKALSFNKVKVKVIVKGIKLVNVIKLYHGAWSTKH